MHRAMSYPQEKIVLVLGHLFFALASWLAAMWSPEDVRWIILTAGASTVMAALLGVTFKKDKETIQLVAARCVFTIIGGVTATRFVVWKLSLDHLHADPILLIGAAALVSCVMFTVGFAGLRYLENRSEFLAKKFIDSKIKAFQGDPER